MFRDISYSVIFKELFDDDCHDIYLKRAVTQGAKVSLLKTIDSQLRSKSYNRGKNTPLNLLPPPPVSFKLSMILGFVIHNKHCLFFVPIGPLPIGHCSYTGLRLPIPPAYYRSVTDDDAWVTDL